MAISGPVLGLILFDKLPSLGMAKVLIILVAISLPFTILTVEFSTILDTLLLISLVIFVVPSVIFIVTTFALTSESVPCH
jgi:hypothetical protein